MYYKSHIYGLCKENAKMRVIIDRGKDLVGITEVGAKKYGE
jgi:hypothetical protein